jgi:PQQ-dependent catabolism-associated CXXCW motif protein
VSGGNRSRGLALLALLVAAPDLHAQDRFGKRPAPPDSVRVRVNAPSSSARGAAATPNATASAADPLTRFEREDFGVAATRALRDGPLHAPTPTSIPGGQVITTAGLVDLQRRNIPHVIIDVLGGPDRLPNAIPGGWLAQPGSFTDQVQGQATQLLQQATQGRRDMPLVLYCLSPHCWMSYNAALRAINAGFTNVLWYRGGMEAWNRNRQR